MRSGNDMETADDGFRQLYHRTWWALLLRGMLAIVVGIFVLARPLESVATFALVIAFWALFSGVVDIVHAIELASVVKHWWVLLLAGFVAVGFGIASLAYYPVLSLAFAVVWVAWWLMLTGILGLYGTLQQKKLDLQWGWTAAFGGLSVLTSAFLFLFPAITLVAIIGVVAGFAILAGLALVIGALALRSLIEA